MEDGRDTNHPGSAQTPKSQQQQPPSSTHSSRDPSPVLRRDTHSQTRALKKQSSNSLIASLPPSISASPQTSRNTSPIRPSVRPQETPRPPPAKSAGLRPRKDSQESSPARPPPLATAASGAPPSAAAIQRALSATNIPQLQPSGSSAGAVTDAITKLPRTSRTTPTSEAGTPVSPHFSPRLRSPGPSAPSSRRGSIHLKKNENMTAPGIVVQSSTPPPSAMDISKTDVPQDPQTYPPSKAPNRGPSGPKSSLETVQEATPPSSSILADSTDQSFHSMNSSQSTAKSSDEDKLTAASSLSAKKESTIDAKSRSGESEGDGKGKTDLGKAKPATAKSGPPVARAKQVESSKNMTVETETVASIPQSALTADRSTGQRDAGGSLRLKPSNETIRPRKERKRATRKTPSIHNGTASSKADIFEARVASAVDEANSSDSDETFVYESNPPEPQLRANRHHSRTPSATSNHSQNDRRALRAYDNHRIAGKRSMKFSNNPYNLPDSPTDGDTGTVRAHHPRNISRLGRTIGSNSSLYDAEHQHAQANKLRQNLATSNRQSSRPSSPTVSKFGATSRALNPWGRKFDGTGNGFDFDGEGADDERTPLVGTVRTPRHRQTRRYDSGRYDNIYNSRRTTFLGRFGGCILVTAVLTLLLMGVASFLFLSSKSLCDVQIRQIQNVLASEQEIMLDMVVGAVNPNVLGITITDMDINIFAKSKQLVTTSTSSSGQPTATPSAAPQLRRWGALAMSSSALSALAAEKKPSVPGTPWQDPDGHWHDGDDDGDKDGLEGDSQTMLLGRVFHFDEGLYFDGSPLRHMPHASTGEFRLTKPGNKTEAGGSERWEKVLQYPFELILRGVLRYNLPVSGRAESAAVRGSVIVHPESGVDGQGRMRLEQPGRPDRWSDGAVTGL